MQNLLRLPQVMERTSLRRSTIYEMMKRGEFPRPIKASARSNAWLPTEVDKFIADRIADREAA